MTRLIMLATDDRKALDLMPVLPMPGFAETVVLRPAPTDRRNGANL